MKKILSLVLFALAAVAPVAVLPAAAQSVATEQTVTFTIAKMTCALCPVTVKKAMQGVAGVRAVEIDLEAKTASVVFDATQTDTDAIAEASANAGYPAAVAG